MQDTKTLLAMLKMPDIDFFIPPTPLSFDSAIDDMSTSRDYVVQGEALQFYLIVKLAELFQKKPLSSGDETSSPTASIQHSSTTSQEVNALGEANSDSFEQTENQTPEIDLTEKISVEFMRVKAKLQDQFKPNASINEDSPVGVEGVKHIFKKRNSTHRPHCIVMENSDILYPLELGVSMKNEFLNNKVALTAVIRPPEYKINIDQLISPLYTERSAIRAVAFPVTVIEPLTITATTQQLGGLTLAEVCITNNHKEDVTILDASVSAHAINPRATGVPLEEVQDLDVNIDQEEFPLLLHPNENYSLILSLARTASLLSPSPQLINLSSTTLHLAWRTQALCGDVFTPVEIPVVQSKSKKIMMTIDALHSPIKLNTIFSVQLTVHNLSKNDRDLLVTLPLPELDTSNDRFFQDSGNKDSRKLIKNRTAQILTPTETSAPKADGDMSGSEEAQKTAIPEKRKASSKKKKKNTDKEEEDRVNGFLGLSSLLQQYQSHQKQMGTIMCLDQCVRFGSVPAKGQKSVKVPFVAMSQGLYKLSGIRILDQASKKAYLVDECCEILIVE